MPMDQTLAQQGYVQRQQYQQMRYMPNPMMGFNPLMGAYMGGMPSQFGGTGRFDGSQMPQFAGPDPAMGGPNSMSPGSQWRISHGQSPYNQQFIMGVDTPTYGRGGGYQQPSQGYGNIAALFSQLFGGQGSMFGSSGYGGSGIPPGQNPYSNAASIPPSMFQNPYGQGGSPFNSYNPFGNMMGSSGPNPLMGGFSSGGGMFGGGQGFSGYAPQQQYGFGSNMPNFMGFGGGMFGDQNRGGYASPMNRPPSGSYGNPIPL